MDASKGQEKTPNKEMALKTAEKLNQAFPNAGQAIRDEIAAMVENMEKKNGKLGHHHEHRSNVSGYKGSEIGLSRAERGKSFKEGIQLEVTNFTSNIKALDIKTKLKAYVEDADEQRKSPIEHAAISQMYDSQLGRNADLLGDRIDGVAEHVTSSVDRMANNVMMKTLGIEFKGREKSILKGGYEAAMRGFYATKLLAKPMFALGQVLTTALIIPEMAQNNHPIRAFYSFGKGMTKLLAHDKKLMDVLFRESQEYGTIEPQLRESLGLDRHTGIESKVAKTVNVIEDYALLGKLGTMADSLSRAVSFATAYTHFTDLGMGETQARYEARRVTGHAMNENGKNMAAPMYSKMGVVGEAMRPLTSFSQNQLGNLAKYYKQMLKGDAGPILAVGLIATATGGIIGLPFMQEYERMRQIFAAMSDIQMPSMLEIMYGDESFFDRLEMNPEDTKMLQDMVTYGAIPALTGIDFTATGRTNETVFSVAASVALGQQEAWKLLPILGATVDVATGVYGLQRAVRGKGTEAEDRKSVDKIISGPWGFAAKRALGAGRTRLFGENTDMLSTGASGNADIQAGDKAVVAGLFGAKTLEQRKVDQQAFEMAAEDKRLREAAERERKETQVAPLLSELFATISKGKEAKQEASIKEAPLLAELQSALSDPEKFKLEKQEKRDKIVELVTELEEKASIIQTKVDVPKEQNQPVVTDLEKKFLKLFNRLQSDFQTLKKYVEARPQVQPSSGVFGSSGSGEVRILRMDDMAKGTPVEGDTLVWSSALNKFELAQPTGGSGGTTIIYSDEEMPYAKRVDFISDNELYKGEAVVGTLDSAPLWRIHKIIIGVDNDVTETWASGSSTYDKVWSDRLTYTYL